MHAFTTVIDGFDGNERHYAGLVAEHLGIPIHFRDLTKNIVDPTWAQADIHTPEPLASPLNLVSDRREHQAMVGYSRVWFYGEGPDNALRPEWLPYLKYLWRQRSFSCLAKTAGELVLRSRRIPFLRRLGRFLKTRWNGQSELARFPEWLNQDLTSRLRLRERWDHIQVRSTAPSPHPLRPKPTGHSNSRYGSLCSVSVTRRPLAQPLRSVTLLSIYACSATCWRSPQSRGLGTNICFVGPW